MEGPVGARLDIDDPLLEEKLVGELKSQGIFDQIRKDCLADVDTTPAYQNLRKRVDQTLESFIKNREWKPTLNKNQLRNQLKAEIQKISGKERVVDRIVEQIVGPKINSALLPEIEKMIYEFFDTAKPDERELSNGLRHMGMTEEGDVEMVDIGEEEAGSGSSSPGIGLAGQISPITPSREDRKSSTSPVVNAGDISPITPSTTPPHPGFTSVPMDLEATATPPSRPGSAYTPPPQTGQSYTPPPRASHGAQDGFTPPLPPPPPAPLSSAADASLVPAVKRTPPPPRYEPESGEEGSLSGISDVSDIGDISPPRVSPRSPLEHSVGDISPPPFPPLAPVETSRPEEGASDVSDTELFTAVAEEAAVEPSAPQEAPRSVASLSSAGPNRAGGSSAGGHNSDAEMEQLVRMRAELMAKLEGDFKLSPEEDDSSSSDSDSDPEDNGKEEGEQKRRPEGESPRSPDDESQAPPDQDPDEASPPPPAFSPSDNNNFSPPPPPSSDGGGGESPENDGNRSAPSPPSDRSSGEEDQERAAADVSGDGLAAATAPLVPSPLDVGEQQESPESPPPAPLSPEDHVEDGGRSRTPVISSIDLREEAKSRPSVASEILLVDKEAGWDKTKIETAALGESKLACGVEEGVKAGGASGGMERSVGPRTPEPPEGPSPEPTFSPVEEEETLSRTPSPVPPPPPPPPRRGPVTPPEPEEPPYYLARGPATPPSPPSAFSGHRPAGWRPPSPKEAYPGTLSTTPGSRIAHVPATVGSATVVKHKKEKVEKKSDKIKEQQKARLEKVEQKVKSKDKLKSDKFQDLDIFSTTKKPFTPHQPYRPPSASVGASPAGSASQPLPSGLKTPNGVKKSLKPNEFGLRLQSSLKEHASRLEQEKAAKTKAAGDFAKPGKQPDRRPSTDTSSKAKEDTRPPHRPDSAAGNSSGTGKQGKDASASDKPRDKDRKRESSKDRKRDREKDKHKDRSSKESSSSSSSHHRLHKERDKSRSDSMGDKARHPSGSEAGKVRHPSGGEGKSRHPSGGEGAKSSRRPSADEAKASDVERKRAHESFMQEAKQRLLDRRQKEEKAEKERRRAKEEARRQERKQQQEQEQKEKELSKDRLKEKISTLDIEEIKKLLTETVAAKEGVTLNPKDSQLLMSTLEQIIQHKKVQKEEEVVGKKRPSVASEEEAEKGRRRTVPAVSSATVADSSSSTSKPKVERVPVESSSSSSSSSESEEEKVSAAPPPPKGKTSPEVSTPPKPPTRTEDGRKRRPTIIASSPEDSSSDDEDSKLLDLRAEKKKSPPSASKEGRVEGSKVEEEKLEKLRPTGGQTLESAAAPSTRRRVPIRDVKVNLNRQQLEKLHEEKEESSDSDSDSEFVIQVDAVEEDVVSKGPASPPVGSPPRDRPAPPVTETRSPGLRSPKTPVRASPQKTVAVIAIAPPTTETVSPQRLLRPDSDPGVADLTCFTAEEVDHMRSLKARLDSVLDNEDNISVSSVSSEELNSYIPSSRYIEVDIPPGCNTQELLQGIEKLGGGAQILRLPPNWLLPYLKGAKLKPEDLTMPTREEIADHLVRKEKKARKRAGGWDIVVEWVPTPEVADSKRSRLERGLQIDPFSAFAVAASQLADSGTKRTRRANGRYLSSEYQGQEEEQQKNIQPQPQLHTDQDSQKEAERSESPGAKKKSSKDRIKAYLKSAGVERREEEALDKATGVLQTNHTSPTVPTVELNASTTATSTPAPLTTSADSTASGETDKMSVLSDAVTKCAKETASLKSAVVVKPASARPVKRERGRSVAAAAPVTSWDAADTVVNSNSEVNTQQPATDMDAELAATENEMANIIQSLLDRKRNNKKKVLQELEEFRGWAVEEIRTPATFLSLLSDEGEGLEGAGAKFGMDRLDALGLSHLFEDFSDVEGPHLEIVMSPAILRDIKKAEQHSLLHYKLERRKSDLARPPLAAGLDLRNGSEGSDEDGRGSSSPGSSFGSAKENCPTVRPKRNSLPPKFNQKESGSESRPERRKRSAAFPAVGGQTPGAPLQKRAKL